MSMASWPMWLELSEATRSSTEMLMVDGEESGKTRGRKLGLPCSADFIDSASGDHSYWRPAGRHRTRRN